ncbi:MAG: acyl-CoA desaturase, partial [Actinomycetota bacterium]|nr:acyl-CoA desaturase [Actinomycetota bacterium]
MTTTHKVANLIGIGLPVVGLVLAIVLLWDRMVGPTEIAIMVVGYLLTGFGITVGYHRLFTHRSFETYKPVRYVFALLGQMAVEGDVVAWVADHRKHHQFSDQEGDPHSPH